MIGVRILVGGLLFALVGCDGARIERAQVAAQTIANATVFARTSKVNYCPTVDDLRAAGELSDGVATKDPWGRPFTVSCKSLIVTVTSGGPDKKDGTSDDIAASALGAPASTRPAAQAAAPPPSLASADVPAAHKPVTRASALAGIAEFQGIIRRRAARGQETDDACEARHKVEDPLFSAAWEKVGDSGMASKTRYSGRRPDLGTDVAGFVSGCLGCLEPGSDEKVPHECAQATIALADLAAEIRAGTR